MKIVLVDDEKSILKSLSRLLKRYGHEVITFESSVKAVRYISSNTAHVVFSDINMPQIDGYQLLKKIKNQSQFTNTVVVLFTGYGNVKDAVKAIREGAYDYLLKPINIEELDAVLKKIEEYLTLKMENIDLKKDFDERIKEESNRIEKNFQALKDKISESTGLSEIGVFSQKMKKIFLLADKFHADHSIPVLIEGETGTGKEIIAKYIHYGPNIASSPFIPVNCASIPHHLFESELFGYAKGAFTGALKKGKPGKFELAKGGTIFLDEIGELPTELQAKLLRVLEDRVFYRVGGVKRIKTNARIIGASNIRIKERIKTNQFRKDLFYRLNLGHIEIPPLRERKEDILGLANLFMKKISKKKNKNFVKIGSEAEKKLLEYSWPGNVRELKNTIEKIVIFFDDKVLKYKHVDFSFQKEPQKMENEKESFKTDITLSSNDFSLNEHIKEVIIKALEKHRWNKTKTAKFLKIKRSKLYWYLDNLDIK